MKSKRNIGRIGAFSILEVTVVLALVALLSALFFAALNRFNEQIAVETKIRNELNEWFAVRSSIWRELDDADSILLHDNTATLWHNGEATAYRAENERLVRTRGEQTLTLPAEIASIRSDRRAETTYAAFMFRWKNTDMVLSYPLKAAPADRVNHYFTAKRWQQ